MSASSHSSKGRSPTAVASTGRTIKRRAAQACRTCRFRKVRCDVIENGSPCTNCRLDVVECVVIDSRRNKKASYDTNLLNPVSPSSIDDADDLPLCLTFDNEFERGTPLSSDGMVTPSVDSSLEFETSHHVSHILYQTQGRCLTQRKRKRPSSLESHFTSASFQNYFQMSQNMDQLLTPVLTPSQLLPVYVQPLPQNLPADDIEYLEKKGALTLPETSLRNELLRSYVQYVHSFMPVLDLRDFLTRIAQNDAVNPISLLLLQAVMFISVAFIDIGFIQELGYKTRREARKVFFNRVRLLYDFDYESDRTTLVQASLLMTHWYETSNDQKDTWHWMGITLSHAYTIGMQRNPEHSNIDLKWQRLRKRIWWSCFIRDRLIALGTRRPTRIRNDEFDVPMLTQQDFDTDPLPDTVVELLGNLPIICDPQQRTTLAITCVELVKLCLCLSHVLTSQYSVLSPKLSGKLETTMMLMPKRSAKQVHEVTKCDAELENWLQNLHSRSQYFEHGKSPNDEDSVTNIHRVVLRMIYLTALGALHRPQILRSFPNVADAADMQKLSKRKIREAAIELTKIACDLYVQDRVRFLPTSGVTALLSAIISHLLDIKSKDDDVRGKTIPRFYQCMQVLHRLREIYGSADSAVLFLVAAIRKARIQIPIPKPVTQYKSVSTATCMSGQQPSNASDPSPDLLQIARKLLRNTSITSEEWKFLYEASSRRINGTLNDHVIGRAAVAPNGLPSEEQENERQYYQIDGAKAHERQEANHVGAERNFFDAFLNLDAHEELYEGEDGFGVDLDVDWMGELPDISLDGYETAEINEGINVGEVIFNGL